MQCGKILNITNQTPRMFCWQLYINCVFQISFSLLACVMNKRRREEDGEEFESPASMHPARGRRVCMMWIGYSFPSINRGPAVNSFIQPSPPPQFSNSVIRPPPPAEGLFQASLHVLLLLYFPTPLDQSAEVTFTSLNSFP